METVTLEIAVERYLAERHRELRMSTWRKQRMTLLRLVRDLGAGRDLDSIVNPELHEWRNALPISPQSANKYMDRVQAFFRHAKRKGWVTGNPAEDIPPLDEDPPRRRRLPPDTFGKLLDVARHPRDRAAIALALELMPRGGEIAALRVGDVDLDNLTITMTVEKKKGVYQRDEMAISPALAAELRAWLDAYRRECGIIQRGDFLFPNLRTTRHGSQTRYRLHPQQPCAAPWKIIQHALNDLGLLEPGDGWHVIRRSCARVLFDHLVDNLGVDRALSHVSAVLHHDSRQTTEHYLGVSGDRVLRNKLIRHADVSVLSLSTATPDKRLQSDLSGSVVDLQP